MHPYNYSMNNLNKNMYRKNSFLNNQTFYVPTEDRFIAGGAIAPFLLGGIAGYAINNIQGQNQNPNQFGPFFYPQPFFPTYYNNSYYYNSYPYYY